jgi:hypothetical protein
MKKTILYSETLRHDLTHFVGNNEAWTFFINEIVGIELFNWMNNNKNLPGNVKITFELEPKFE